MVDAFNQWICYPLRFQIWICIYGYLRVSPVSLETDVLYFTFKTFVQCVLVLHLPHDGFAFVLRTTSCQ